MYVRLLLDDPPPLDLGPDHEGVHRALDVVGRVLLGLERKMIFREIFIHLSIQQVRNLTPETLSKHHG